MANKSPFMAQTVLLVDDDPLTHQVLQRYLERAGYQMIGTRNGHFYPSLRQWVWKIPRGCVYTRDLPRPAGCTADPDLGCAAAPDVHVRFQRL